MNSYRKLSKTLPILLPLFLLAAPATAESGHRSIKDLDCAYSGTCKGPSIKDLDCAYSGTCKTPSVKDLDCAYSGTCGQSVKRSTALQAAEIAKRRRLAAQRRRHLAALRRRHHTHVLTH